MIEPPANKRPSSVFWAGIFFWLAPLPILAFHLVMVRRGIVDPSSFFYAGLLLGAALSWSFHPRTGTAFYLGGFALVATVVRGALTARAQYLLRAQFPDIIPQVVGSVSFAVLFAWLAGRYIFGLPSRQYFPHGHRAA